MKAANYSPAYSGLIQLPLAKRQQPIRPLSATLILSTVFSFWVCSGHVAVSTPLPNNQPAVLHFANPDCSRAVPGGYTRIFIAYRNDGKSGAGTASDPFDGSTAEKFDSLLRSRSEAGLTHLMVCLGPGTFQTEGSRDYVLGEGHHDKKQLAGFTVNQGWKIHGAGVDQTVLQLTDLYFDTATGKYFGEEIITTYDLNSYGVEISDLTLDANFPQLKARYKTKLELQAIFLQSNRGEHWIHDIHVMNVAGELAEDFPVEIGSPAPSATASTGNVIEHVTLDHWGGGECTAIAVGNSVSEIRYNTVVGYWSGYGGWRISNVHFHDNQAIDTVYGFNIDSLNNSGVVISHNQIVHPQSYGIVIGGIGQFRNFSISENTITLASPGSRKTLFGMIEQGNVEAAQVIGNQIITDHPSATANIYALYEKGDHNSNNVFQDNKIWGSFRISVKSPFCAHGNTDENGGVLQSLRDTQSRACVTVP
ncbi:MAG: hypothetical protein WBQ68_04940 [Terriglobales bacterium]